MVVRKFIERFKLHHVLFWLALFGAWYYFRHEDFESDKLAVRITAIKVIDLAILVYITNLVLIPKLLYRKKYTAFVFIYIVMIFASSLFKVNLIGHMVEKGDFVLWDNLKARIYDNVIPHILLVSTGAAFKLLIDYARAQRRMGEMAKEKAEAELNFLKSQINPHFLFNSLNSVYFLIDKDNIDARQALHKFSDMLRYQLYELKGEKISIEKEITYLRDYVDLQRLRRDENCLVQFHCSPEVEGFSIEPLLLIPFVENSFKHLSHYGKGRTNEINIDIIRSNGEMKFSVSNTTEGKQMQELKKDGGIGLGNVKRRLELLYPDTHKLNIEEKDGWYWVKLIIKIDKN
jgi:two-component system, LytTR family, sensor kinase